MSLCIATGGQILALVASSFTLSWTHSVEKTEWIEHWQVEGSRMTLVSASVQGSGAGIDLPPSARWEHDRWTYEVDMAPLSKLTLAASGTTVGGWTICGDEQCLPLGKQAGEPITIWATEDANCAPGEQPPA